MSLIYKDLVHLCAYPSHYKENGYGMTTCTGSLEIVPKDWLILESRPICITYDDTTIQSGLIDKVQFKVALAKAAISEEASKAIAALTALPPPTEKVTDE